MAVPRDSRTEPFQLVRRTGRETHASWFDHARNTMGSMTSMVSLFSAPPMVVVRRANEMRPVPAGLIAGALAGPAMLGVASLVTAASSHYSGNIAQTLGLAISRGAVAGDQAIALGIGATVVVGALVGALFAFVARRLRQLAPLLVFGTLLATSTWMVVQLLAMPRFAPWLARALPIGPMMIGAAVFGLVCSMELPLRTRRLT